jgi:hypothetical protein
MQRVVKCNVGREQAAAGHQGNIFQAGNRSADDRRSLRVVVRHYGTLVAADIELSPSS